MNFSKVYSAHITGLRASVVDVECDISGGLNAFNIVGLPDKSVEESRDRVGSAVKNSGFVSPKQKNQKTIISLAPAHIKKEGASFDLAMALAYLLSAKDIVFNPAKRMFLGELSLDGMLRPVKGVVLIAAEAHKRGFEELYLPAENAREAGLISGIRIYGVSSLAEVVAHLNEKPAGGAHASRREKIILTAYERGTEELASLPEPAMDFADIAGQESAKRALEIAAAGRHNIALYGPPGTGKTLLAQAFPHLLPLLSEDEMLETTGIHSVAGILKGDIVAMAPFRSPHHTSSYASLIGGGTSPRPGEVTLAHNGVLFLDEFPEFDRRVIETLRQPLQDREIHISRAKATECFPANFILVAALNPCPCGNFGSEKACVCREGALTSYQRKLSGPIVDRIDIWAEVGRIDNDALSAGRDNRESTAVVRKRVEMARMAQTKRYKGLGKTGLSNAEVKVRDMQKFLPLTTPALAVLKNASLRMDLSPRSYHKIIKLARTIADLAGAPHIEEHHVLEALQYRPKNMRN